MMISFGHLQFQRDRPSWALGQWGQHGLAFSALFLAATLAVAQQAAEAVLPSQPAEISKGSPVPAPPDGKGAAPSSKPLLQTHPSPAAAANAQRAARQSNDASIPEREDPGSTALEPANRPIRATPPPRSSPEPSP